MTDLIAQLRTAETVAEQANAALANTHKFERDLSAATEIVWRAFLRELPEDRRSLITADAMREAADAAVSRLLSPILEPTQEHAEAMANALFEIERELADERLGIGVSIPALDMADHLRDAAE